MNQQDKIELSKRVADKYGVSAGYAMCGPNDTVWLADDDARCFRLALDNGLCIEQTHDEMGIIVFSVRDGLSKYFNEHIDNHSDRHEATRIAILKCLDAMKG